MENNKIDQVRGQPETVLVLQNEVKLASWLPRAPTKWLATEELNGCTGVAIISPHAGILAHIAPVPTLASVSTGRNDPGRENLTAKLQEVIYLYNRFRQFFAANQGHVVAALFGGTQALPEAIRMATGVLYRLWGKSRCTQLRCRCGWG